MGRQYRHGIAMAVLLCIALFLPQVLSHPPHHSGIPKSTSIITTLPASSSACTTSSKQAGAKGSLVKRVTPFDQTAALGEENQCQLMSPYDTPSPWKSTDYDELPKQGWRRIQVLPTFRTLIWEDINPTSLSRPWPHGIDAVIRRNAPCAVWSLKKDSGEESQASGESATPQGLEDTDTLYNMMIDVEFGVIFIRYDRLILPEKAGSRLNGNAALLSELSDVAFLEWSHQRELAAQSGNSPQSPRIRYILIHKIGRGAEHPEGQAIINDIFQAVMLNKPLLAEEVPDLENAKGYEFVKWSDLLQFRALLGTGPGHIVTKLLSEHRETLGQCRVAGVMVFAGGDKDERKSPKTVRPSMLFKIEEFPGNAFSTDSDPTGTEPDFTSSMESINLGGGGTGGTEPVSPGSGEDELIGVVGEDDGARQSGDEGSEDERNPEDDEDAPMPGDWDEQ